jgi:hypothetical protein
MKHSILSLQGVKILSKNAQQKISGGMAQAGTCAYESLDGDIEEDTISKADAIAGAAANGTHWCCDSCHSASWYAGDI